MASSPIEIANSRMTISQACALAGADFGGFEQGSMKTYCPFGHIVHIDGGTSKTFRVYPEDNTAFCFAGCGFFTPVRLVARFHDLSDADAADMILEQTNYVPPDYVSQWEAQQKPLAVDTDSLSEALQIYCQRIEPLWEVRQFDEDVAHALSRVLGLLVKVRTSEQATQWLSTAKQFMKRQIGDSSG